MTICFPRFVEQYGFWEWVKEPARLVRYTRKGNPVYRPVDPIGWLREGVFDKVTGVCLSRCLGKHVPENYRRWRVEA